MTDQELLRFYLHQVILCLREYRATRMRRMLAEARFYLLDARSLSPGDRAVERISRIFIAIRE